MVRPHPPYVAHPKFEHGEPSHLPPLPHPEEHKLPRKCHTDYTSVVSKVETNFSSHNIAALNNDGREFVLNEHLSAGVPHCVRERVQYRDKTQIQDRVPGAVPRPHQEGLCPHHQVGLVISGQGG